MPKNTGFSLVELSIVLVILGLLTGGILSGQALIRASELRTVTTDFTSHLTRVATFRDKYFALPGDMNNATRFWGVQTNATACRTTASTTTLTCDGNGDGRIDTVDSGTTMHERFAAFKHLANAGLLEGSYTGVTGPAGQRDVVIGTNTPTSRLGGGGWSVAWRDPAVSTADWYTTSPGGNFLLFGSETGTAANFGLLLKAEEAWGIDTKIDDGKPAYGVVIAMTPAPTGTIMPNCTTTDVAATAAYNLSNTANSCALIRFLLL